MATAKKAAPAKVAPAPAPVAEAVNEVEAGMTVKFLGYDEDTPEAEQVLVAGETYEVIGVTEAAEDGTGAGNPVVRIENPDFNPKKKEHPETNAKMTDVEMLPGEFEIVDADEEAEGEEEAGEEAEEAEEVAEVAPAKTAAKTAAKGKTKAAAPVAEPAAKTTAKTSAKTAAKGKTAAVKPVAAKKIAKVVEPAEEAEVIDPDALPDLEVEDPEVLALIEGVAPADLIGVVQDLEIESGTTDYKMGGVLYHIKKEKAYLEVEGGEEYAEKGGWGKFVSEYFSIEYRKAQHLIKIYVAFQMLGIENPGQKVAELGWSKASKIAPAIIEDATQGADLVKLAESTAYNDLTEALKEQVTVGGTPGEKATRLTLKFRFFEDEAATVNQILVAAQEQLGLKDLGDALLHILGDWASNQAGGDAVQATAPKQSAVRAVARPAAAKRATAKA